MRVGAMLLVVAVLLTSMVHALYYTNYTTYIMWSPSYTLLNFHFVGIAVTKEPITLGDWAVPVEEVILDGLPPDTLIRDLSRYRRTVIYGIDPGMRASPWLPNGTHIEYAFTRATALFEPVEDIDVRRDVKWYVFTFHYNDVGWLLPAGVRYGLEVAAKSDDRPVFDFSCLICQDGHYPRRQAGGLQRHMPWQHLHYVLCQRILHVRVDWGKEAVHLRRVVQCRCLRGQRKALHNAPRLLPPGGEAP
jgi:hypothetical protein